MTEFEFFKKQHPVVMIARLVFKHLAAISPMVQIQDIADTTSGGTPDRGNASYYGGSIPWLKSGELTDGMITEYEETITEAGLQQSSAKIFPAETLLVAMYGATAGKTGILGFDSATNQAVCAIFPKVSVQRDYLFWYFRQERLNFLNISRGGAQPNISQKVINNALIPLPPAELQSQVLQFLNTIADTQKIAPLLPFPELVRQSQTLFNAWNTYIALGQELATQKTLLAKLREAILREAVQGKLTHPNPADEDASHLLARITAEKAANGIKEKPLAPIKPEEIPYELPQGWVWCRLGEITNYGSSAKAEPKDLIDSTWVLDLEDIEKETSKLIQKVRFKERNSLSTKSIFKQGNVLYSKLRPYLDKVIVADEGGVCTTEILPLECFAMLNPFFLRYALKRPDFIAYTSTVTKGMKMPRLGTKEGRLALIPLPPLAEQERIVAAVERLLGRVSALEQEVLQEQETLGRLMQSALREVFANPAP